MLRLTGEQPTATRPLKLLLEQQTGWELQLEPEPRPMAVIGEH
jgi:hypothetical protein